MLLTAVKRNPGEGGEAEAGPTVFEEDGARNGGHVVVCHTKHRYTFKLALGGAEAGAPGGAEGEGGATLEELRAKVALHAGVAPAQQKLLHKGRVLAGAGDASLAALGVRSGAKVMLVGTAAFHKQVSERQFTARCESETCEAEAALGTLGGVLKRPAGRAAAVVLLGKLEQELAMTQDSLRDLHWKQSDDDARAARGRVRAQCAMVLERVASARLRLKL